MSVFQVDVKSYVTIGYLFERIASSLSIVFCCDTNFHYILQKDGLVKDCVGIIEVGNRNWIGNSTTLMRGTQLPTIPLLASRSFVNKSFLGYHDDGILIAGSPGKVVRLGDQRVFFRTERDGNQSFLQKK